MRKFLLSLLVAFSAFSAVPAKAIDYQDMMLAQQAITILQQFRGMSGSSGSNSYYGGNATMGAMGQSDYGRTWGPGVSQNYGYQGGYAQPGYGQQQIYQNGGGTILWSQGNGGYVNQNSYNNRCPSQYYTQRRGNVTEVYECQTGRLVNRTFN